MPEIMGNNNPFILLTAAFLFFSSQTISIASEEGEPKYSYYKGAKNGPENWAGLQADYANCSAGNMQSPINIDDSSVQVNCNLGQMIRLYKPAPTVMLNKGHAIQVIKFVV